MSELFSLALVTAYAVMGGVALLAFGPTLRDLWHGRKGVNPTTYLMWLGNALIGALYGLYIVSDVMMVLISSIYAACCVAVVVLNWRLEKRLTRFPAVPDFQSDQLKSHSSLELSSS